MYLTIVTLQVKLEKLVYFADIASMPRCIETVIHAKGVQTKC